MFREEAAEAVLWKPHLQNRLSVSAAHDPEAASPSCRALLCRAWRTRLNLREDPGEKPIILNRVVKLGGDSEIAPLSFAEAEEGHFNFMLIVQAQLLGIDFASAGATLQPPWQRQSRHRSDH